ncbi:ABC transporter ATP-binding protein [Enterovirga rhinocerotis]|uniref:Iron complex transport system ATP-binding protein n=1 Tax=Enterovirga rhinocerotis TaxID=1339210 RepID=A0A4R7BIM0_9HYPH|nr:ATP-binding cassette domain-containing protein [Enterovirga rhinocerotis]TDR85170.1 iron complex transport system ATP-binding protein [Enterovirga rhinocerotis]
MSRASGPGPAQGGFLTREVGFSVEGRPLLSGISLDLAPGRFVGLIGHNGSGKSTLLKILARQQEAGSGEAKFGGQPLTAWPARGFACEIAYLPQTLPAATGLTVRELASFGRYPWRGPFGRLTEQDRAIVEEAMGRCRVEPFAERIVDTLSGGERQRAWLAMLVAQDAGFLLLDEPVSALDLAQQVEVLGLLRNLAEGGKGVVAVLHDINMAARFCHEIVALRAGRVIRRGRPDEIMDGEALEAIYGLPMQVMTQPGAGHPVALPR